jgi:hypothetical protein
MEAVLGFQEILVKALPLGEGTKKDGAVGNGFITRRGIGPGKISRTRE